MFYDLENRKYHHVPIKFYKDSEGKWWAIFNQNKNGGYALVRHRAIFKDMKNHWTEDDINLLASKLIVKGMPDGRFMPDENITRAQYIALLIRGLGLSYSNNSNESFKDINEDDWYAGAVEIVIDLGIVKGYEDGTFQPNKLISREEMSVIIVRVLNCFQMIKLGV
ncbi:MAG: S-layer homology domain-containing protein [Vallitalea sp.]|jgi:hypothetical protein|nr:S-layer homology domain-containing protein [Vallitalea sp.]